MEKHIFSYHPHGLKAGFCRFFVDWAIPMVRASVRDRASPTSRSLGESMVSRLSAKVSAYSLRLRHLPRPATWGSMGFGRGSFLEFQGDIMEDPNIKHPFLTGMTGLVLKWRVSPQH